MSTIHEDHALDPKLGCFKPTFGQIWTNPTVHIWPKFGLKQDCGNPLVMKQVLPNPSEGFTTQKNDFSNY